MRGYQRRHRYMWNAVRWQTFYIMSSQIGSDRMRQAGLRNPTDLMPLPWDNTEKQNLPTEEEIAEILEDMKLIENSWKR